LYNLVIIKLSTIDQGSQTHLEMSASFDEMRQKS